VRLWAIAFWGAVALAAAALLRSTPLVVAVMAGLLVALAVEAGRRRILRGVTYHRGFSRAVVSWGGEVEVVSEVRNRKWLPVPWLRVRDRWPLSLDLPEGTASRVSMEGRMVEQVFSLRWQETVRHRVVCRCRQRGVLRFGPAEMTGGEPLGFAEASAEVAAMQQLVVLPKVLALPEGELLIGALPGEIERASALAHDPTRLAGVRPYRSGDPLRQVNWRATARMRRLHVSELEPVADERVMVALDLRAGEQAARAFDAARFESLITVAASVAAGLCDQGCAVGLVSNGCVVGHRPWVSVEPATESLSDILGTLARIVPSLPPMMEPWLAAEAAVPRGATDYVLVTSRLSAQTAALVEQLRRVAEVTVVFVGGRPDAGGATDGRVAGIGPADERLADVSTPGDRPSEPGQPSGRPADPESVIDLRVPADFDWEHEDVLALA